MSNTIVINEEKQIGEQVLEGDQTKETMVQTMIDALKVYSELSTRFGKIRILVDVSRIGTMDPGSQESGAKELEMVSVDKLAVIGTNEGNRPQMEAIIAAAGKQAQVKFFDSRQAAEDWLINPSN